MSGTLGVVLAAGASRRFGAEDKLLADWNGAPLVCAAVAALERSGAGDCAAVVSAEAVAAVLPARFRRIWVAPGLPMAASFHAALDFAEAAGCARLLLMLGDMPGIGIRVLERLLAGQGSGACRQGAVRMPPMLLQRADFGAARAAAQGDRGARGFLATLPETALVPLEPEEGRDIDRPSDLG